MTISLKSTFSIIAVSFFPLISNAAPELLDLSKGVVFVQEPRYSNGSVGVKDGTLTITGSNFGFFLPASTISWSITLPAPPAVNDVIPTLSLTPGTDDGLPRISAGIDYGAAISMLRNHSSDLGVADDQWTTLVVNNTLYFSAIASVSVLSFDYKWDNSDFPGFDFPNLPIDASSRTTEWRHVERAVYASINVPSWFPVTAYSYSTDFGYLSFSNNAALNSNAKTQFSVTTADNFGGAGVLTVKNLAIDEVNTKVNIAMVIPEPEGATLAIFGILCFVPLIFKGRRRM